jgi:capsular polysaccharide biosynthesis protein
MDGRALDLKRSAQIVWRLKWLVATVVALGILAGAVYTVVVPASYQSRALVAITPSVDTTSQAAVVTSPQVLAPVLGGVDHGVPFDTLRSNVWVLPAAVGLMAIVARDTTPGQAIATANAVARSYVAYAAKDKSLNGGPVPVQIFLPAASASGTPLFWRLFYATGGGLLIGLILGLIAALAVGRGNRPLRERDEIADSIGVPVLTSVHVSRPAKPADWTKLLNSYQPVTADGWRLRRLMRELGHADLAAGDSASVAILSLAHDAKALALAPQLAAFAAQQGIPATLVLDARLDAKVVTALRQACAAGPGPAGPGRPDVAVIDPDGGSLPATGLVVVAAVLDGRAPRVRDTVRTTTTVLGVGSGAATAQQLVRLAASAIGDGRDITGILVAGPDPHDPTTGRLPQLARLGQPRMPIRMTTAVTEIRQ